MERRRFLAAGGALAAGAGLAAPALAATAPRVKWRIASGFPKSLDLIHGGAETFAQALSEMTDGAFTAQVAPAGDLAPGGDAITAAAEGRAEAAYAFSSDLSTKDPSFALGAATPFGPNTRQMNAWLRSGGSELLDAFYAKSGLVGLACGATGAQMGGWFRKDINAAADLQGVRMRLSGLAGPVAAKLGLEPQTLGGAEIAGAFERGALDAAEWIGPYDDNKLALYQSAPNYYYPGWHEGGPTLHLLVNKAKWDDLPASYRAAARGAAAIAYETTLAAYDARNPKALRAVVAAGAKLKAFSKPVLEALYGAAQEFYAELYRDNADFRTIHEAQAAFRNEDVLWFRVAELPYDLFMAQMQARG